MCRENLLNYEFNVKLGEFDWHSFTLILDCAKQILGKQKIQKYKKCIHSKVRAFTRQHGTTQKLPFFIYQVMHRVIS